MHHIYTEVDAKSVRDMQRRLNLNMKEVVRKEVIKWLYVGIIYPISDSRWVSPTQVVPKKFGLTVIQFGQGGTAAYSIDNRMESLYWLQKAEHGH